MKILFALPPPIEYTCTVYTSTYPKVSTLVCCCLVCSLTNLEKMKLLKGFLKDFFMTNPMLCSKFFYDFPFLSISVIRRPDQAGGELGEKGGVPGG
jgi:hypothetical protein